MKTGGFDLVVEVHEKMIDKALADAFYTSSFPEVKGTYVPEDIPAELRDIATVDYEFKLKEPPYVDALRNDTGVVRILVSGEIFLTILGGIRIELDANICLEAAIGVDPQTGMLVIDLVGARIDEIALNDKYGLPRETLDKMNNAISIALRSGFLDQYKRIEITSAIPPLELPYMPPGQENRLPVSFGALKVIGSKIIVVALNFVNFRGGTVGQIANFADDYDLAAGVSESGMHRVFDFWWDRTTWNKSFEKSGTIEIDAAATVINALFDIKDFIINALSLGFVEITTEVLDASVDYGVSATFEKPGFDLRDNNNIRANCMVHVKAWAELWATIRTTTEIDVTGPLPDIIPDQEVDCITATYQLLSVELPFDVDIENASATVYVDDKKRLMAKDFDVDLELTLPWNLPTQALNGIIDVIEDIIKHYAPPVPLSPSIFTVPVPGTMMTLLSEIREVVTNDVEAIVGADVTFNGLPVQIVPVPKFIADRRPRKREVHREECELVDDIPERFKTGYFCLYDAFEKGFSGCKICLPEYERRRGPFRLKIPPSLRMERVRRGAIVGPR